MFCKHCGKQIDEDASFCSNCGKPIKNSTFSENSKQIQYIESTNRHTNQDNLSKKQNRRGVFFLLFFIFLALLVGILVAFVPRACEYQKDKDNPNNSDSPLSRNATLDDVSVDYSYDFPVNVNFVIVAKTDINNLELTFTFLDSNQDELERKVKVIGNLDEGERYSFSFSATDFSFGDLIKISYTSWNVTGGTVSYL